MRPDQRRSLSTSLVIADVTLDGKDARIWALAGTILLAVLIIFMPIRRATRLRPGQGLRYA